MAIRQPGAALPVPCADTLARIESPLSPSTPSAAVDAVPMTLADVYRDHFAFVWRTVRRFGVAPPQVEDAVQDVFVVVHRRLLDFEGRSSVRTWLAGIVRRVVRDYRRTNTRKPALAGAQTDFLVDDLSGGHASPEENVMANEAARLLHTLLDQLDDEKREVFILAELEQWSLAEIAEATGAKLNTASSRLRLAREAFEQGAQRLRARDAWRLK